MTQQIDAATNPDNRQTLEGILNDLRHWLPQQGPIKVFIHHNTLHALEGMSFETAVEHAADVRHTQPYLSHAALIGERGKGRIGDDAIARVLETALLETPGDGTFPVAGGLTRKTVWRHLLEITELVAPDWTIEWLIEDGSNKLWNALVTRLESSAVPAPMIMSPARKQADEINERLATLAANYLDQGISYWPMPHRERGFLEAFRHLSNSAQIPRGDALDVLLYFLGNRHESTWHETLLKEALELPGWAGMFSVLETRPHLLPDAFPSASLADFLAVRVCMKMEMAAPEEAPVCRLAPLYTIYRLLRSLRIDSWSIADWSEEDWSRLVSEVERFGDVSRRRLLQQAYEQHFYDEVFGALIKNASINRLMKPSEVKYQVVFCIDEREESLRRHLEETSREIQTFSVAGFFGVDMWYQGIGDLRPMALCPVVIAPKHLIREAPAPSHSHRGEKRKRRQRALEIVTSNLYDHSRNLVFGWWLAAVAGVSAAFPLLIRIHFPRWATRFNRYLASLWFPPLETDLLLIREGESSEQKSAALLAGFTLDEMVIRVEGVLKAIGLVKQFSPLVFIVGHGSSSLNNPHESAYDCGACGGGRGGPNARAFAKMANLPTVREKLRERGISIPDTSWFVGGMHDTASDEISFFDTFRIPDSHRGEFEKSQSLFQRARTLNAHERCRRFESAQGLTPEQALVHVEGRCRDLREPRPECGHATNAWCVVGRRALTKNLYLDRRCFLASYDASLDSQGDILAGILGAVIPVCAGISLEYYFSFIDNEGYGCGSKLPHNVTSLIGVMNGRLSDLRTGLPWQMVEIHEPMRILFAVEAEHWKIEKIVDSNQAVGSLVKNGWVRLAAIDPLSGAGTFYVNGKWTAYDDPLPALKSYSRSQEYFEHHLDHLGPVRIQVLEER